MSNENQFPKKQTNSASCESCIHSRRCFMSGEYCSKQLNIYQERRKLHNDDPNNPQINAFVVMNFSDMSDVVYKWRLKEFIRSLTQYLYINRNTETVICSTVDPGDGWVQVKQINVLRADSNPASNYVICNRVCQQMQIADLVIVDVTVENTNVFYEFGMAVALDKLILPICYNDSFYAPKPPKNNVKRKTNNNDDLPLEKHIDCFPWRRRLFEYFGLRYRNSISKVQYFPYAVAVDELDDDKNKPEQHNNGFTDVRYKQFPYHQDVTFRTGKDSSTKTQKIGQAIYEALANSYNAEEKQKLNTLVIYTMDGFVNGNEAAQCIINFYEHMTAQVWKMNCFCGDRVVTLVQEDAVGDDNKDAKEKAYLPYKVGDLIHIGMNQATYVAQRDKIVTSDFLNPADMNISPEAREGIVTSVKTHIGNKSLMLPLSPPIYVEQVKNGLQQNIFVMDQPNHLDKYFCFFHIMLRTLQYANEIVVDISNNSIEALFWLGMAHGADIQAITVRYEHSEKEFSQISDHPNKKERNIFDVAGLWTAVLKSHDTEGFYHQLALAQTSIEQHSKLMLKNADLYAEEMLDILREAPYVNTTKPDISALLDRKKADEESKMESYYRDRFWSRMIRQNRLHLYMPQKQPIKEQKHQLMIAKWDVDAISALSHYLSKRKVISESYIEALNLTVPARSPTNFISIGADASPYTGINGTPITLGQHINEQLSDANSRKCAVRLLNSSISGQNRETKCQCALDVNMDNIRCRGFISPEGGTAQTIYALLPDAECSNCSIASMPPELSAEKAVFDGVKDSFTQCPFPKRDEKNPRHIQLGQMILWREHPKEDGGRIKFQVSLIGASGPASYALSSLLVDEYQKRDIIHWEKDEDKASDQQHPLHLLSELQRKIRTDFMGQYEQVLACLTISDEILHHIKMYLSTVLYRYFFPFLSEEDEQRISNGLTAYLTALKFEKKNTLDNNTIKKIVDKLKELLKALCGVEAMYAIEVEVCSSNTDDRIIRSINPISTEDSQFADVSCIYFEHTMSQIQREIVGRMGDNGG